MKFKKPNHYIADKGKTFRRIIDQFIMGNDMFLYNFIDGTPDKIENYEEINENGEIDADSDSDSE